MRTAFIVGFSVIATTTIILLYVRLQIETIKEITGFKYLAWGPAMATTITIGIFAIFAFIVTIWRGNLHSAQVKNQVTQLEQSNKQLRETENNNIAKLLVDGTKLLGDKTSEAEKIAGIACLAYIAQTSEKFAKQASISLKVFIEKTAKEKPEGFFVGQDEVVFVALDALNDYAIRIREFIPLAGVQMVSSMFYTSNKFWPNLANITYKYYKFKDTTFDKNIAKFFVESCSFTNCKIDSIDRMRSLPDVVKTTDFDTITGEEKEDFQMVYHYPSKFWGCLFDDGDQSEKSFMHMYMIEEQRHEFDQTCAYNDKDIKNEYSMKIFQSKKIKPFSLLTAEERLKIGPQTT